MKRVASAAERDMLCGGAVKWVFNVCCERVNGREERMEKKFGAVMIRCGMTSMNVFNHQTVAEV